MDVAILPLISPNNYVAFRRLLGSDIPNTYNEWLKLQTKEIRGFVRAGLVTKTIGVNSDEFSRFLRARGAKANIVSLRNFTIDKDAGNIY